MNHTVSVSALERQIRKTGSRKVGLAREGKDIRKLIANGMKVVFWEDPLPKNIHWDELWGALNTTLKVSYPSAEQAEDHILSKIKNTRDKKLKEALRFLCGDLKKIRKDIFPQGEIRRVQYNISTTPYDDSWHCDTAALEMGEVRWIRTFVNRSTLQRIKRRGHKHVIEPETGVVSVHTRRKKHREPKWEGFRFNEIIDVILKKD